MDLKDAALNLKLVSAGLPAQAVSSSNVTAPPPASDPYAPAASSLVQLSGYGRALSAVSQFSNALQAPPTSTTTSISSAPGVATTSSTAEATSGTTYAVNVAQIAQAQQMSSAYFGDASASYFTPGSFTIQSGSTSTSINVTTGSLNGIVSAVNSANAGVTAAVQSDSFGFKLVLTGKQTGATNTMSISAAAGDPFGWSKNLGTLGLSQSQAASDASYTIDGTAGTSTSNQNIAVGTGVTMSLVGTGATQITVAPNYQSALANAQNLISQYNVLRGNVNQLTAAGGQLVGDTTASQLSADLYNTAQNTVANPGSTLTTLAQVGITTASESSAIALNSSTFQAAYNSDPLGTYALLNNIRQSFTTLTQNYGGSSGTLQTQSNTVMTNILQGIQSVLASSGVSQSTGIGIYQNEMLYNSVQSQYSGISLFV
ncbi:MAG: flagellar filament capping protein FliD [Sulfuricella sp.]|nr:flagellar filament capping protein FliD [Sulfuricella sp.]